MPEYKALLIGYIVSPRDAWAYARACVDSGLDGIDLNAGELITKELVDWLHARGKTVAVWVFRAPAVNDVEAVWTAMAAVGVDDFPSNLPPAILAWKCAAAAEGQIMNVCGM